MSPAQVARGRDLTRQELREMVLGLAAEPGLWAHLVRHDPDVRIYEQLLRTDHVAVWLICWSRDHDTGFHDHDTSAGALAVAAGAVLEDRLRLPGPPATQLVRAGSAVDFDPSDIHRVRHAGPGTAVTLNAYSPPLWRMGAYEVGGAGELRRHSISYAEELRPLGG